MKTVTYIIAMVIFLGPMNLFAQNKKRFTIDGKVQGLKDGTVIKMAILDADTLLDSSSLKDGKFLLSGIVPEGPRMVIISFPVMGEFSKNLRLLVDNGQNITLDCHDIFKIDHGLIEDYVTVKGCPTHAALHYLIPVGTLYMQSMKRLDNLLKRYKDSVGFEVNLANAIIQAKEQLNEALYWNFFQEREDSNFKPAPPFSAIPFFIMVSYRIDVRSRHAAFLMQTYNHLTAEEKNTFYGKKLYESARLSAGEAFPTFTLPTIEGKPLSIQQITSKGKVTIVHFWATNSFERNKFQDELRFLYKKYHDRGLNIVGFSSDNREDQWKESLQKEKFPWYNVSDLKGEEGMVGKVYHEIGDRRIHNTTNVLLDDRGKIIAWDVDGIELQWYLWKAFEASPNNSMSINQ